MADRVSKQVLAWSVIGESNVIASVGHVQAAINNTKKASDQLHESLTDLRVLDAAKELGAKFGVLAGDIEKADDATAALAQELQKIGASKGEIAAAATEFERFRKAQSEMPTFSDADLGVSGGGGGLRGLGSKIRSLPSVRIPGTELGTDAIGNLARVLGTIPPAALPAAAALAAVGVAIAVASKAAPDFTSGIRDVIALDKTYYEARIKGTKDSINAIIEQKQLEQKIAQARVDDLAFVAKGYDELHQKTGIIAPGLDAIIEVAGALNAPNFKDIRDARLEYDKAQEELKKANKELTLYNGLVTDQGVIINTTAEALKKFNETITEQTIHSIQKRADVQQEIDKLVAEGSEKELDDKRKQLEATRKNAELQLKDLQKNIDAAKEGSEAQQKYQAEFDKQNQIYNDATYELSQLGASAVRAATQLNDAKEYAEKQNKEIADAQKAFNDDTAKENADNLEKKAAIEQKYQDTLIKAAETLADAGEKALQTLKDKREDLLTSFQRASASAAQKEQQKQLEDQIKFQEDSAKAAREHARDLRSIQEKAQQEEQDLIASRDFAGLFKSRRNTTIAIQNANRDFQEQEAERALQFQQKHEADARQYAFEQQQRLVAYQQANEDAQKNYDRQIAQANQNYAKQLQQAANAAANELNLQAQKHAQAVNILQSGLRNELSVLTQGAAQRIQLEAQTQQALIDQAKRFLAGVTGGLNSAGSLAAFAGIGAINNNSSSSTVNAQFNIRSNNPQSTADIVHKTLREYLVN